MKFMDPFIPTESDLRTIPLSCSSTSTSLSSSSFAIRESGRTNNEKFRPILEQRLRESKDETTGDKEIESKVARRAQRWKTIAWRSREATDFPRARGEVSGFVHYLAWNDDVEPWECTFQEVEESRRIRVDGYLLHDLSNETEKNSAWLRWPNADTQRSSEEEEEGEERKEHEFSRVCWCVCVRKRLARPRGLIRCGLIQAVSLPLRILHTWETRWVSRSLWPCERSILQARPLERWKVSSNVTLESFELRVSSLRFLCTSLLGQRGRIWNSQLLTFDCNVLQ